MNALELEREILFTVKEFPERQNAPGYSVSIFAGPRRKLAEAVSDISEDDPGKPIDDGLLSARSGLSLAEIFKEFDGHYPLKSAEAFQAYVNELLLDRLTTERTKLLNEETRVHLNTRTWDAKAQAKIGELTREIEELERGAASSDPTKFLKTGSELQLLDINVEYDIEDLVASNSVNIISALGGTGKTWIGLAAAKHLSEGTDIFGKRTKKRPVVYVDFENPISVLVDRARKLNIRDVMFWHQHFDPKPPRLDTPGFEVYHRLPAGAVIVFDTLRAGHSGDDNASDDMHPVMSRLKELRDKGRTVTALHHSPKANERISKGSTVITDEADNELCLYRVKRGTYEQLEDDSLPPADALFRFGTGKKTRFKPAEVFLQRSPDGPFVLAEDPNKENLDAIAEFIRRAPEAPTQSAIFEWAKVELEIKKKGKFSSLMSRGEGTLWNSIRQGNRRNYVPL